MHINHENRNARLDARAMMSAAAAAAVVDAVVGNPLQMVRTRIMANNSQSLKAVASHMRAADLWRGLGPQLYSLVPRRVWSYTAHQGLSRHGPLSVIKHDTVRSAAAGVAVGVGEGLLFTPTRQISIVQQLQDGARLSTRAAASRIVRDRGMAGLWRGASLNAVRTGLGGGAYFGGIAATARMWPDAPAMLQGAMGAAACAVATSPMEVVLTRLYARPGLHWAGVMRDVMREGGPRAFFAGLSVGLARGMPAAALNYAATMYFYRRLRADPT